ncbi:class I SAM-dependent methyltransferase [Undibacterium sp.]|uniref:class I SAM-dependent methyltransferase n=1 Tax=Undibacterium sp. TaxID=1914977 RepID=UPI00374D036B
MREYYAQRAKTYETIYQKPERQADLQVLKQRISTILQDHKVLELACGTGYWTESFAAAAASVTATDINQAMLDIAQSKVYPPGKLQFAIADAFDAPQGDYSAYFAGHLWSHIKREEQAAFLAQLSKNGGKDKLLVLMDNNYVEGSSTPIARTDMEGNTYQQRLQEDGTRAEVVKNFPTDSTLRKRFGPAAKDIRIQRTEYYWLLTCVLR